VSGDAQGNKSLPTRPRKGRSGLDGSTNWVSWDSTEGSPIGLNGGYSDYGSREGGIKQKSIHSFRSTRESVKRSIPHGS